MFGEGTGPHNFILSYIAIDFYINNCFTSVTKKQKKTIVLLTKQEHMISVNYAVFKKMADDLLVFD